MDKVIDYFGGKSRLAAALGVTRSSVSQWIRHGLPAQRAIQIEEMTARRFLASELVGRGDRNDAS